MLKIEGLTKAYGNKKAVDNLSLHIQKGEIYGFIGHNGAGKTTTLKSCAGILRFDAGEIFIDGISIKQDPIACKKRIAYIPDNPDLYEFLSGVKYLNFIADVYGVGKAEREARIAKYAALFELTGDLAQPVNAYSHGMKQKLILTGALLHDPETWLLDEPMTGLDPASSFQLKQLMREHADAGKTVLFSTHVLEVAERVCDRLSVIDRGKLLFVGTMSELKERYAEDSSLESLFLRLVNDSGSEGMTESFSL